MGRVTITLFKQAGRYCHDAMINIVSFLSAPEVDAPGMMVTCVDGFKACCQVSFCPRVELVMA